MKKLQQIHLVLAMALFFAFSPMACLIGTVDGTGEQTIEAICEENGSADYRPSERFIAHHWAPLFLQDTNKECYECDFITAYDFDGDLDASNNFEHTGRYPAKAYVYYSVLESNTHYFLSYYLYHPKDETPSLEMPTDYHNDNEMKGVVLVIAKTEKNPYGTLELMTTMENTRYSNMARATAQFRHYRVEGSGLWAFSDTLQDVWSLFETSVIPAHYKNHAPTIYVNSKNHNLYGDISDANTHIKTKSPDEEIADFLDGVEDKEWTCDPNVDDPTACFPGGDGIVYRYKPLQCFSDGEGTVCSYKRIAETPDESALSGAQEVAYDLLPIEKTLWQLRNQRGDNALFDEFGVFNSVNKEPAITNERLLKLHTAPWRKFDYYDSDRNIQIGEIFYNPADYYKKRFDLGNNWSTEYHFNPYAIKLTLKEYEVSGDKEWDKDIAPGDSSDGYLTIFMRDGEGNERKVLDANSGEQISWKSNNTEGLISFGDEAMQERNWLYGLAHPDFPFFGITSRDWDRSSSDDWLMLEEETHYFNWGADGVIHLFINFDWVGSKAVVEIFVPSSANNEE